MESPKVSIVVPVYNVERWLDGCMACVFSQTFQDFEVILVDDGSTDRSGEICDKYAATDWRVRVIHKENEGAGPTRTAGMLAARGEYLYFPDSDDWFDKTMLEEMYALAKEHDADMVACGAVGVHFDEKGNETGRSPIQCKDLVFSTQDECRANAMELFPTSTIFDVPWNKLYRRSVAIDNGLEFRRLKRCQDAVFNLDFYNCCSRVVATSKAYYYYRENTQQLVWRKFPKNYIDIQIAYYLRLKTLLTQWGIYEGWVKEHYDTSFVIAVSGCAEMYDNPVWNLSKAEQKTFVADCIGRPEVRSFLPTASVRPDQWAVCKMLVESDVEGIMRRHEREVLKERLRQCKPLIVPLRLARKVLNKLRP